MAMSTLESGPKLDWTRDNQMYERYRIWRKKVEFIFCSALADFTPKQLVSYLKYWMGDQGIPLIEKWESTGKLDYSNSRETPATEGGRRKALSSGYKLQTYWDLLDEEFKPKGNKLLSIIELWTRSKQGDRPLNQWLTQIYNLVNICKYPEDSTDRIIRDVLIVGCNSNHARDKIIRQGEAVTLNEVIEILQTEESTHSTMQQIQSYDKKSTGSIYYQTYDSRSKKSKVSNEQNSSSSPTGSKKKCFRCGENFSRQHMKECRAQDVTCNGCGIKGHLKKCCKKSGNFPKDSSNRQNNQSSSTGPGKMNIANAVTQADFFDEKGVLKEYNPQNQQQHTGSMYVLKKFQGNPSDILFSDNGVEIQHNTPTSVSGPDPTPIPTPDFPFQEFPLTEIVKQSQIDISSISDTSDPRETSNSSSKATKSTDLPLQSGLKSGLNSSTHEELREIKGSAVSTAPTQSLRDSNTIFTPDNSATRESNPGIDTGITTDTPSAPTTFSEETDVTAIHAEIPEELQMHSSKYRSVIPTDTQALTALQNLISDDFQAKDTHSTQRKGEKTPDTCSIQRKGEDETFELIQKIHNQLQEVQWDLQRLHSLHKYKN